MQVLEQLGLYGGFKGGQALANAVGQQLATGGGARGIVGNILGGLMGMQGQQAQQPTPQAPINVTPQAQAQPQPQAKFSLGNLVKGVAGLFGFKNKTLVNAIATIAENTGKNVKEIYEDLKKSGDISTPEKAAQTAQAALKQIQPQATKELGENKIEKGEQVKQEFADELKSSVIRKMFYDKKDKRLKVIFNNDATYSYDDFPLSRWAVLSKGAVPAKTSGENEFGIWWEGKNPSKGAAFSKIIKPHLRKAGPYQYARLQDTPMTEEEFEELEQNQIPLMGKAKKYIEGQKKIEKVASKEQIQKAAPITESQKKLRELTLTKQFESLRALPENEKHKEMIRIIEDRLQDVKKNDKLLKSKKSKVITDEILRMEKTKGESILKRLATLLPKEAAKFIKNKIGNASEEEILKAVLDLVKHFSKK